MTLIWQLIVGLIVGVLARLILPGREAFPEGALGWLLTAILGVAGAWIGGVLGGAFGYLISGFCDRADCTLTVISATGISGILGGVMGGVAGSLLRRGEDQWQNVWVAG